jgi:hypothetical protein
MPTEDGISCCGSYSGTKTSPVYMRQEARKKVRIEAIYPFYPFFPCSNAAVDLYKFQLECNICDGCNAQRSEVSYEIIFSFPYSFRFLSQHA